MRFYIVSRKILIAFLMIFCCFFRETAFAIEYEAQNTGKDIIINLLEENENDHGFHVEVISVAAQVHPEYRVFIYHTHTYEAYDMRDGNHYQPTETWRTADVKYNVVRIGEELCRLLEEAGVHVTHDKTDYEMPRLSTAYSRSLEGLKEAAAKDYDLYIDLHRDSYSENNGPNSVQKGQQQLGRYLFLIGQGTGTGFDEKPDWESNQKAAKIISDAMNMQVPGLSRGVSLKSGRYNQQAATPAILIEAGNNKNTLTEMLASVPYLANAICSYFDTL